MPVSICILTELMWHLFAGQNALSWFLKEVVSKQQFPLNTTVRTRLNYSGKRSGQIFSTMVFEFLDRNVFLVGLIHMPDAEEGEGCAENTVKRTRKKNWTGPEIFAAVYVGLGTNEKMNTGRNDPERMNDM